MCINKQYSEKKASLHKYTDIPSICIFSILCLKQASLGKSSFGRGHDDIFMLTSTHFTGFMNNELHLSVFGSR